MAGMVSAIGAFKENTIPQHCDDNDKGYENEDKDAQEDNDECVNYDF